MTRCPGCGDSFERIAQHWGHCGYPMPTTQQRAILRGLMLAGATVAGNGHNRHVEIGTASPALAEWTAAQLDWLCHGVREVESDDAERGVVYRVRTPAHPICTRFERWSKLPANSGRAPPEDLVLSRTSARVWWAHAGGLEWAGPYDSQRQGVFSAERDERAAWIVRVLEDHGYNPTETERSVRLPPTETDRWLEWLGDPVPGVAHRWTDSLVEYRALREQPATEVQYRVAWARAAIEVAAVRTDQPLTADLFEQRVDADADVVAEILTGGGAFSDAVDTVLSPREKPHANSPASTPDGAPEWVYEEQRVGIDERDRALQEAAADCGEPLSSTEYMAWRNGSLEYPHASTITNRWGWVTACREAGVEPAGQYSRDLGDFIDAVIWIYHETGSWPDPEAYRERKNGGDPSVGTFYRRDWEGVESWSDLIDMAKKECEQ